MTTVFFLFLVHLAVGLMAMLPFVPGRAGVGFFKLCSAAAATMTTAALGLLLRRYGWEGSHAAPAGDAYRILLATCGVFLVASIVFNRAWHFGWARLRRPLLALSLMT
ncbi:MAG: hypothetical protein DMF78_03405, partial [Acidobacteria bacterium]